MSHRINHKKRYIKSQKRHYHPVPDIHHNPSQNTNHNRSHNPNNILYNYQSLSPVHHNTPFVFQLYKFIVILLAAILILSFLYHNSSIYYRKSITLPFSLHLNENDLYLIKGEEFHLSVFAINKRVSYYSTNFRVAGVNFNGRVFGYRTGKAFIIAKVKNKELKCRVHVIDINKESLTLKEGNYFKLKILGTRSHVKWKSSNKEVATVSMSGKVKALNRGNTVITARIKGKVLKCKIHVQ